MQDSHGIIFTELGELNRRVQSLGNCDGSLDDPESRIQFRVKQGQ